MKRFAFYGRVSTEDQQDPASSKAWQLSRAEQLIAPVDGAVVAEFFDIGMSRSLPWKRRPEAARLLDAFKNPGRGFDAVVIGEPARAFYGGQFSSTYPVLVHYGVELWVPEVGGMVDPGSEAHDMMLNIFGSMSRGERNRIKVRVRAAMATQARTEGRFLGGRPPYGYQLGDAGPHPNPAKSAAGQRARRLEVDASAAPIVQRIFTNYLGGLGLHAIAEGLNRDRVPSPSEHDPARNRHRTNSGWSKSAIRAILKNPRYTGHQVWNRQRRDETDLIDVEDPSLGFHSKMKWNDRGDWIWSADTTHEAIITTETFARAQEQLGAGANRPVPRMPRSTPRPYALRGLLFCGSCGRKMQGNWSHGRASYRCRYAAEYAGMNDSAHRAMVYIREDAVVPLLDAWLAQLFDPVHIDQTVARLIANAGPTPADNARLESARRALTVCDTRLEKYRAALETGADPAVVATWIAEVQGERLAAERTLNNEAPREKWTKAAFRELLDQVGPIPEALACADIVRKARVYAELGIVLTYEPENEQLIAEARPPCAYVRVGGASEPIGTPVLRTPLSLV